ncbi:hypothetical protein CAPTEDRAFT_198740 [Capitella teleta]|uniref:Uncharacterized protein n=1 Tax=Capitella teleta TaxID=283909 RepID=R7V369_CAPTE|nr:hypothetical protein CAPTEDRAFT_198740 [Capitella teleta]|eukprot:ELU12937.1 hypothetical protein CAPTEDRAFT_198740 [Capitella teleta]
MASLSLNDHRLFGKNKRRRTSVLKPLTEMDALPSNRQDVSSKRNALSSYVKGGIGLMIAANVDFLVAFSTAYWATWKSEERGVYGGYGLWKMWHCTPVQDDVVVPGFRTKMDDVVCHEKMADLSFPEWYVVTQVFQTLGLAGFLASIVLLLLYAIFPTWRRKKLALSSLITISYISGVLVMVAIFVFCFKVAEEIQVLHGASEWFLSWSFSLCCTAFVMNQIAASILVTESKRISRMEEEEKNSPESRALTEELKRITAPDIKARET